MNYNIPPPGKLRFSSRYRWIAPQSTVFPFHFESKTSGESNSPQISSSTDPEIQSAKCQNKLNVSVENEKTSNSPLTDKPINVSLSSNVSSTMSSTSSSVKEMNSSECLPPAER
ncbi:unnamed protein product [Brugia timori]|uniref:Ovule protein n=1 Tax=Brugia timori TaxID=42155 RepID=A0A0R3QDZ4_9BILA|nr:unnamed protein product [Brugia timori]